MTQTRKDDRRCIDCGRTRDQHRLAMVRAKCASGDAWGLYESDAPSGEVHELRARLAVVEAERDRLLAELEAVTARA
jgi:hypothetical protein